MDKVTSIKSEPAVAYLGGVPEEIYVSDNNNYYSDKTKNSSVITNQFPLTRSFTLMDPNWRLPISKSNVCPLVYGFMATVQIQMQIHFWRFF